MQNQELPKNLWIYWHEGWNEAPIIVKKCIDTWRILNPNWKINILAKHNLEDFINLEGIIPQFHTKHIQLEALSDIIRISLLYKYGGVWVDATLYCNKPLDTWLHTSIGQSGFFAFSKPAFDRLISSWFLASTENNYIINAWYFNTVEYWKHRSERDDYFWFHFLFGKLYNSDNKFKLLWDHSTIESADAPHCFSPYDECFSKPLTAEVKKIIDYPHTPVFKLTHKYSNSIIIKGSTLDYLLNRKISTKNTPLEIFNSIFKLLDYGDKREKQPKILIAWFGAFDGHGTIGDLLSLQSLTNHLHNQNINFDYTSYESFQNLAGNRVDWKKLNPNKYTIFIWVCGPMLKNHAQLSEIFDKFINCTKIGVGVSLFRKEHFNFFNPFDFVFAREGTTQVFDDIALAAPIHHNETVGRGNKKGYTIGISLRGRQGEYGEDNCLFELTENTIKKLAEKLLQNRRGGIVIIENHLKRSGIDPEDIENLYSECDLVITSRLHGALIALRHSVPYIAIDQIKNGAKVYGILNNNKWPYVYKIEEINNEEIALNGNEILSGKHTNLFGEFRAEMLERSNYSLQKTGEYIQSIIKQTLL